MFGILYFLYGGCVHLGRAIKKNVDDTIAAEQTYNPETGLYQDSLSHTYKNGEQMFFTIDKKGHNVYENKSRTTRVDLTQIQMDKEYEEAKRKRKDGVTVVELHEGYAHTKQDRSQLNGCSGIRYRDLDNGKVYVIRCWRQLIPVGKLKKYETKEMREHKEKTISKSKFYMDVDTGMLVRVVDHTYEEEREFLSSLRFRPSDEEIDEMIEEKKRIDDNWIIKHNEKQKDLIKQGNSKPFYFYHNNYMG